MLTDATIAELAGGEVMTPQYTVCGVDVEDALEALAVEVQAHRARRCGNCAHFAVEETTEYTYCRMLTRHQPFLVSADWFCAGFTAKETV